MASKLTVNLTLVERMHMDDVEWCLGCTLLPGQCMTSLCCRVCVEPRQSAALAGRHASMCGAQTISSFS